MEAVWSRKNSLTERLDKHNRFQTSCLNLCPRQAIFTRRTAFTLIFSLSQTSLCKLKKWLYVKIPVNQRKTTSKPPTVSLSKPLAVNPNYFTFWGFSWTLPDLLDHIRLPKCIEMRRWWGWGEIKSKPSKMRQEIHNPGSTNFSNLWLFEDKCTFKSP